MASLLQAAMEPFVFMDETTNPDGYGGYISTWSDGAQFNAAAVYDQSLQAKTAEVQGVSSVWTVTVPKTVRMDFHKVFRRLSDGKIFRCTSKDFKETPKAASFQVRQIRAEEWMPE